MSCSDDSDCDIRPRVLQRKKVKIIKVAPSKIGHKKGKYSSDDSDSDSTSASDNDEDCQQQDQSRMTKRQPKDASPSSGFTLPGSEDEPKIFVLVGSCNSGKSYMLKYMMERFGVRKHFGFGICLTSTKFTGAYDYLPDRSVRDFDMAYLESYVEHLRKKIELGKKKNGAKWNLPHNYVIIDDSLGLTVNSSFFQNFVSTHRHTRTTIFLLTQLLTAARSVSTVVRANTSYAMMFATSMQNAVEGLYQNYGQMYSTMKEFKKELDECRKRKYSCLVFTNDPSFTTPEEAYCKIVAPANIPEFELKF